MRKLSLSAPLLLVSALLGALSLAPRPLRAANFFVDDTGTGAACTAVAPCPRIATAVGLSAAGDAVFVAAGTYNESGILIPHSLAVIGASAATVTVDGNGSGPIFRVDPGTGLVLLSRMTLTDGDAGTANSGGAIRFSSGDLTVTGSQLIGNSAHSGGAISQQSSGQLLVTTSLLADNSAGGLGGAIVCVACGGIEVSLSVLRDNSAGAGVGGAIAVESGTLTVRLSSISYNSASQGGGIHSLEAPVTIYESTLRGNSAVTNGGALFAMGGTVDLQRSTFAENEAGDIGGAVHLQSIFASMTVSNSTFSGNSAGCGGAFIFLYSPIAVISTSTFYNNVATAGACGNHFENSAAGVLEVSNSIIHGGTGISCSVPMTGGTHNLIDDATCDTGPKDFNLGAVTLLETVLAYNGGPTQTHLIGPKSTAVEAGDKASCLNPATVKPLVMDQRTLSRPFDHDGDGMAVCDIGAVELR